MLLQIFSVSLAPKIHFTWFMCQAPTKYSKSPQASSSRSFCTSAKHARTQTVVNYVGKQDSADIMLRINLASSILSLAPRICELTPTASSCSQSLPLQRMWSLRRTRSWGSASTQKERNTVWSSFETHRNLAEFQLGVKSKSKLTFPSTVYSDFTFQHPLVIFESCILWIFQALRRFEAILRPGLRHGFGKASMRAEEGAVWDDLDMANMARRRTSNTTLATRHVVSQFVSICILWLMCLILFA